jgi:Uma2 family endonuclease
MAKDVLSPLSKEVISTPELDLTSIWKLSVKQYHQMIQTGTLNEDDPVELLEGWLVTKADYVRKEVTPQRVQTDVSKSPTSDLGLDLEDIWKLSVEQYHQMIASGILNEDDPVELLEGWLVTKMAKDPTHRMTTHLGRGLLEQHIPDTYYVDSQEPITTNDSEPEPDIVVVKGNVRDYSTRHPNASEVLLVVEVSNSTLSQDRTLKQRTYAASGIPIYWIINLVDRVIEVYTQPLQEEKRYAEKTIYDADSMVPLVIDGKELAQLAVKNLLP